MFGRSIALDLWRRIRHRKVKERSVPVGSMASTILAAPPEQSVETRYQSLIRLADSIRVQTDPRDLFRVVVNELCKVIPFDAIAQFDEFSRKVNWHLGEACQYAGPAPSEIPIEETLAWWVSENQQPAVVADIWTEGRFPFTLVQFKKVGLRSAGELAVRTAPRRILSL